MERKLYNFGGKKGKGGYRTLGVSLPKIIITEWGWKAGPIQMDIDLKNQTITLSQSEKETK
jgi:hypothetical protein